MLFVLPVLKIPTHISLWLCLRSIYIFVSAVGEFKLNCFHSTAFFFLSNVLCSHLAKAILILRSFEAGEEWE